MTHQQHTLFDRQDLAPRAKARRSDPDTSHDAAKKVEKIGKAERDRRAIRAYLRETRGRFTSAEIGAAIDGMDRHTPARRLPELREAGLVRNMFRRECRETGNSAITWESTE